MRDHLREHHALTHVQLVRLPHVVPCRDVRRLVAAGAEALGPEALDRCAHRDVEHVCDRLVLENEICIWVLSRNTLLLERTLDRVLIFLEIRLETFRFWVVLFYKVTNL